MLGQDRVQSPLTSSTQILVVTTADWSAVEGTLQRYERSTPRKHWRPVGPSIPVVVGKTGLGWGTGVVAKDSEDIRSASDPVKKEGDGRAPAGIFRLGTAFGYASQAPGSWRMHYLALTPSVECVDDTKSSSYNRVVDRSGATVDWNSSEHMLRLDDLYRWGIVVQHNSAPATPGLGSCIFMHIWRGPGQPTVGCTAMQKENIETVLSWLDPAAAPMLMQLPVPAYQSLKKRWKLPKLPRSHRVTAE